MIEYERFCDEFRDLVLEAERGRLSVKILPTPTDVSVLDQIATAVRSNFFPVVFDALVNDNVSLMDSIAGMRHLLEFEGKLDGQAVLAIVLSFYLLQHDKTALLCQQRLSSVDDDERTLVFQSTECLTLTSDPDALQRAIFDFCLTKGTGNFVTELAQAIYGRCESYGTKTDILTQCHNFFNECVLLTDPDDTLNRGVSQQQTAPVSNDDDNKVVDYVTDSLLNLTVTESSGGVVCVSASCGDAAEPPVVTAELEGALAAAAGTKDTGLRVDANTQDISLQTPPVPASIAITQDAETPSGTVCNATPVLPLPHVTRSKARSVSPGRRSTRGKAPLAVKITRDAGTSPLRFYEVAASPCQIDISDTNMGLAAVAVEAPPAHISPVSPHTTAPDLPEPECNDTAASADDTVSDIGSPVSSARQTAVTRQRSSSSSMNVSTCSLTSVTSSPPSPVGELPSGIIEVAEVTAIGNKEGVGGGGEPIAILSEGAIKAGVEAEICAAVSASVSPPPPSEEDEDEDEDEALRRALFAAFASKS
jgi:hypothetical protein